ncbi:hypothetical protein J4Q44_G00091540 [Coregonus suidteri]|uniref:Uncharacterized protein n=1 Tax=Coregonus suidteri TaxID=861788 RepID=A0AAN8RAT9_9TELE
MCANDLKSTVWQMLPCILSNHLAIVSIWTGAGYKVCFRDLFLKTILHTIRKSPATQDATDEVVQIQATCYLKGASDCEGRRRRRTGERYPLQGG